MKQKQPNGSVLILAKQSFRWHGRFDKWHTHGYATSGPGAWSYQVQGPGLPFAQWGIQWVLQDGSEWVYGAQNMGTFQACVDRVNQAYTYVSADGSRWGVGEWYNFCDRSGATSKQTLAEWYAVHD